MPVVAVDRCSYGPAMSLFRGARRGRRPDREVDEATDRIRRILAPGTAATDQRSSDVPVSSDMPARPEDDPPAKAPSARPRPRPRLVLDGPSAAGVALVVMLGALLGGWYLWRSQPDPVTPARAPVVARGVASPTPSPSSVVIDVAGKVRRPGVVTLPAGSRVVDALRVAGGARPGADTSTLNLARILVDGEQVLVGVAPAPGAFAPPGGATVPGAAAPSAPLNLNTATLEQLDELPNIGPVLGQRILDHRAEIGGFSSVDQLKDVSGIGEATFGDLVDLVQV